jgi:hypothetical protein
MRLGKKYYDQNRPGARVNCYVDTIHRRFVVPLLGYAAERANAAV